MFIHAAAVQRIGKSGPSEPDKVAKNLQTELNCPIVIDANDLGVAVLGKSNEKASRIPFGKMCLKIIRLDNLPNRHLCVLSGKMGA